MPFTAQGSRYTIHAPAAVPRSATKTLARTTGASAFENLDATTPPPVAKVQEIARPNVDLQSSPSVDLDDEEAAPARDQKRKRKFPLWLAISLAVLGIGIPVGALAIFGRSKPAEPTTPAVVKKTTPSPTKPTEPAKPHYRPLRELLPSDTAAMLVYFPRPYWDAEEPNLSKGLRAGLDILKKSYGFDPRLFERGVVAFQPNGVKYVAAGEAAAMDAAWLTEFEKTKGRMIGQADTLGIRPVRYNRANVFVPKEDKVIGALLPPHNGIGGAMLSDSQVEMNALMSHMAAKVPPANVSEEMVDTSVKAARAHPHAFFAASGDFDVPRTGEADPPSLGTFGINLFTATMHYERKWTVEIDIAGPDEKKLRQFFETVLPKCFENALPAATAIAAQIRRAKAIAQVTTDGSEKHLKATLVLENAHVCSVIEYFLGK